MPIGSLNSRELRTRTFVLLFDLCRFFALLLSARHLGLFRQRFAVLTGVLGKLHRNVHRGRRHRTRDFQEREGDLRCC